MSDKEDMNIDLGPGIRADTTASGLIVVSANKDEDMDRYFPKIDHGIVPCGGHVLIQGKMTPRKSKGGVEFSEDFRQQESYDVQIGKLVALGPLAYKFKDSLEDWKEGTWVEVGDFVHIPRTGAKLSKVINGDRYWFTLVTDVEVIAKITTLDEFTQFSY